jgi:hypothetical protein
MMARRAGAFLLMASLAAVPRAAAENYALVIAGASGGQPYAQKYDGWRSSLVRTLTAFGYPDDHVMTFSESTKAIIEQALRALRARMTRNDQLFVALIGHGTAADAKFNMVGPDITAGEWVEQLKPISGRIVFVDMTSGSFPFLHQLAGPGRLVITATDSAAQEFETVFPEFFIKAFADGAADTNKDGRVSIAEAFEYATANVRIWFDQHNQLPTERPLLEGDSGLANATFLQPRAVPANDALAKRQSEIESEITALKARRPSMAASAYDAELERLLTELARASAQARPR